MKIVSAGDAKTQERLARIYRSIIKAGIHIAPTIKTAEAAKVIENIQRDLNIALMNELSIIFDTMGLDTREILLAASTKWNFHPYMPGLVGGHCIGVDPYYLTYKASQLGYKPEIILAGRKLNDAMYLEVLRRIERALKGLGKELKGSEVLILGLTFKENIRDTRNCKTKDLIRGLIEKGARVTVSDPNLSTEEMRQFHDKTVPFPDIPRRARTYAVIIVTVAHHEFRSMHPKALCDLATAPGVICDLKRIFDRTVVGKLGHVYTSL